MKENRSNFIIGAVLLVSLAVSVLGTRLLGNGVIHGWRSEAKLGFILFISGITLVPAALCLLANRFVPSERERLRKPRQTGARRVRHFEESLRHLHFFRRNPWVIFIFLLFALVVEGASVFAADSLKNKHETTMGHFMGATVGTANLIILVLFLYTWITRRWEPYIDHWIRKTEERLAKAKSLQNPPPL